MLKQEKRWGQYKNHGRAERFMDDLRKRCLDRIRSTRYELLDKRRQIDTVNTAIREACTEFGKDDIDSDMIEKLRIELLQEEFSDVQQFEMERDMDMIESINDENWLMCPSCLKSPASLNNNIFRCHSSTCGYTHIFPQDKTPSQMQLHAWLSAVFTTHIETGCTAIPRLQRGPAQHDYLAVSCPSCGFENRF